MKQKSNALSTDKSQPIEILANFMVKQTDKAWLAVTGADAQTFLNGQISADLKNLAADRYTWAVYCNRQGKVLSELLVIPYQAGYLLQLDHSVADFIHQTLAQYAIFSKTYINNCTASLHSVALHMTDLSTLLTALSLPPNLAQMADRALYTINDQIWLRPFSRAPHYWLVCTQQPNAWTALTQMLAKHFPEVPYHWWQAVHISQALPTITQAISGLYNPFELGLDKHEAIAFKKGCYIGQEIISRIYFQGKVKTHCYQIRLTTASEIQLTAGQSLYDNNQQTIATIVNVVLIKAQCYLLLVTSALSLEKYHTCYIDNSAVLTIQSISLCTHDQ